MRRLYLTGGTGFIGMNIFERWKEHIFLHERGTSMEHLVNYNPHYIIHSAAEIYEEGEMFDSNVRLTHDILQVSTMMDNLKAMIVIGSSSEYGLKDHPIKEDEVLEPFHWYAGTKAAASMLTLAYAKKYQLPIMIARPFSVYGKHEPDFRFIPTAIRCMKANWKLQVAPGSHDFIYISDFVEGLFKMLENPKCGEIYNFGTGKQYTNLELVKILEKISGKKINYEKVDKMREFDTDCWVCDNSKAKKELGWEPKYTLEKGLARCLS